MSDPKQPDEEPIRAGDGAEKEPDSFEILMAEALGQESELDSTELELLIAAGERAGDLAPDEFEDLDQLARSLDSAGALDEIGRKPVSAEERAAAAQSWSMLVGGQAPQPTKLPPIESTPWWQRRPLAVAAAVAALVLAAFLGGRQFGIGESDDPPSHPGRAPEGTLGGDPNAPDLTPSLSRGENGDWTITLAEVATDLRPSLRDLLLELEVKGADGVWTPRTDAVADYAPGTARWTWRDTSISNASSIRFRIELEAPAGRPGWTSDWFVGDQLPSQR